MGATLSVPPAAAGGTAENWIDGSAFGVSFAHPAADRPIANAKQEQASLTDMGICDPEINPFE